MDESVNADRSTLQHKNAVSVEILEMTKRRLEKKGKKFKLYVPGFAKASWISKLSGAVRISKLSDIFLY